MFLWGKKKSLIQNLKDKNKVLFEEKEAGFIASLKKSSEFFKSSFLNLFQLSQIDESFREKIQDSLLSLDFGVALSKKISNQISLEIAALKNPETKDIKEAVRKVFLDSYMEKTDFFDINFEKGTTNVFLVFGANGTGKTTSIAKLANFYKQFQLKILIVAADTFRAGAVDQLKVWAEKIGIDIVVPEKEKEDPSALIYKSLFQNEDKKYDLIICDTSGKQHTNKNLLQELQKIHKVINKFNEKYLKETFLVIDSTIGQSSFLQAENFLNNIPISGLILTKMDSLLRGGIIFRIKEKFKVPVKLITTGEKLEDIHEFDLEKIVNAWLSILFDQ